MFSQIDMTQNWNVVMQSKGIGVHSENVMIIINPF